MKLLAVLLEKYTICDSNGFRHLIQKYLKVSLLQMLSEGKFAYVKLDMP